MRETRHGNMPHVVLLAFSIDRWLTNGSAGEITAQLAEDLAAAIAPERIGPGAPVRRGHFHGDA
jgi:hypothetical protein